MAAAYLNPEDLRFLAVATTFTPSYNSSKLEFAAGRPTMTYKTAKIVDIRTGRPPKEAIDLSETIATHIYEDICELEKEPELNADEIAKLRRFLEEDVSVDLWTRLHFVEKDSEETIWLSEIVSDKYVADHCQILQYESLSSYLNAILTALDRRATR